MELSREAYLLIVQHVNSRSDLYTLTLTSRAFQRAAERALYNTLVLNDPAITIDICRTLASNPRLGSLVDALTIFASPSSRDETESHDNDTERPEGYWESIATALAHTTRLRHLNIHVDGNTSYAWVLRDAKFDLESFYCELTWDVDLVTFLNSQDQLRDLYLADFMTSPNPGDEAPDDPKSSTSSNAVAIRANALPALTILECSFIDAIAALVPGRPVTRIKTCFSREDLPGKTEELRKLAASLQRASVRVRSLDLADSSYTEEFSLAVLGTMARHLPELRYFGTLVLPVGLEVRRLSLLADSLTRSSADSPTFLGPQLCLTISGSSFILHPSGPTPSFLVMYQRLQFFGLLMRLRSLYTVELEVSEWDPAPTPQAMRALASELRLYCPSVQCFVFVQEFERTFIRVVNGRLAVDQDPDSNTDNLWRENRS